VLVYDTMPDCQLVFSPDIHSCHFSSAHLTFEGLRERTEYIDIFLFSTHHSIVFCFRCSVYWWKGSVRF